MFSEEKKFYWDCPDSYNNFWSDLQHKRQTVTATASLRHRGKSKIYALKSDA